MKDALDLINRQKAEKEALIAGQETLQKHIAEKKAEIERSQKEINRLQTEIGINNLTIKGLELERSCQNVTIAEELELSKAEAIKEFAERLCEEADNICIDREGDFVEEDNEIYNTVADWCKETSDTLVKEMVGDV